MPKQRWRVRVPTSCVALRQQSKFPIDNPRVPIHGHSLGACQDLHSPWSSGNLYTTQVFAPSERKQSQRLCASIIGMSWKGRTTEPPHQLHSHTEREQEQAAGSLLPMNHQRGTLRVQPQPTSGSRKHEEAGSRTIAAPRGRHTGHTRKAPS